MRPNFLNLSISLLILAIVAAACSSFTKGKAAGEKAVEKFHAQFNEEKFEEIYNQSAKDFQISDSKENIIKFLQAVRRKLGKVTKTSGQGWHVNSTPLGSTVRMTYETEFEQDKATETFTFYMSGEETQLAGYYVNSKKLVTE